jgi:hypothetical protein
MSRYRRSQGSFPTGLAFLVAVALVFGGFYIFRGMQDFFRTGGLGVDEATRQAALIASATAARVTRLPAAGGVIMTPRPTATPPPECIDFRVSVPAGIVRESPGSGGAIVTQLTQGTTVCVLAREPGSEWYTLDLNPSTRRIDLAYMHETVIEAVNPTLTPTRTAPPTQTFTPAPPTSTSSAPTATLPPDSAPLMPPVLATVTHTS